jgi:uncharacterized protein with FMN-binding domain
VAKKISNTLVGLSSAAILAIYAAGYERTTTAADRFVSQSSQRRAPTANESPVTLPAAAAPASPSAQPVVPETPAAAAVKRSEPAAAAAAPPTEGEEPATTAAPTASFDDHNKTATVSAEPATQPQPVADTPSSVPQVQSTAAYKDGVFLGWGYSRHGNIQAFVRIEDGRIVHAGVQRCDTRWPCDLVAHLPGQVISRQSAEVDYVTGATQSGDAFYGAVAAALAQAK